jgi:hypothetical protein
LESRDSPSISGFSFPKPKLLEHSKFTGKVYGRESLWVEAEQFWEETKIKGIFQYLDVGARVREVSWFQKSRNLDSLLGSTMGKM